MNEQHRNMLTGIFVIAACCLVVTVILFLEPEVGDGKKTLRVRFSNISKIYVGTRVVYAGRPVGEVMHITQNPEAREDKTDNLGRLYFYDLTLKVDSSVDVYHHDLICIQTAGLLGDKSIAIVPRPTPKGQAPLCVNDTVLYGDALDPLETAFNEMSLVSQTMQNTLSEVSLWMQNFSYDTGKAMQSFGSSMNKVDLALEKLDKAHFFETTAGCLNNLSALSHKLASGEGTLGKILDEEGLFYRLENLFAKADTLMDDINHYGLLFHTNRGWQRLRTSRMNQAVTAKSPKAVASVLAQELADINTSMTRLSKLSNCFENNPEGKQKFTKVFLELQDRTQALLENIKTLTANIEGTSQ
jgi:phospholipid/cholesterol/gamma-HCH transport system substrate-binding protein